MISPFRHYQSGPLVVLVVPRFDSTLTGGANIKTGEVNRVSVCALILIS